MTTAFETATTAWFSGYPALKQRMFDRMVKAKGYNPKLMGPELERELWRRIDDYWIACFEAKLRPFQEGGVDAGLIAYDGSRNHHVEWAIALARGDDYAEVELGGAPPAEIERRRAGGGPPRSRIQVPLPRGRHARVGGDGPLFRPRRRLEDAGPAIGLPRRRLLRRLRGGPHLRRLARR